MNITLVKFGSYKLSGLGDKFIAETDRQEMFL